MSDIRLMHLADIHLGFTGPTNFVFDAIEHKKAAGRYVREIDIEEALERMRKAIINKQPPVDIVVIAGDLFHRPAPYPRAISRAARFVRMLIKHDIAVVIIDGNHETASVLHTGSPTTFLKELGAQVVNGATYKVIQGGWSYLSPEKQDRLAQLAIHALPYGAIRDPQQFTGVLPLSGYTNVLLAHGRVSGMDNLNSLHRAA